VLIECNGRNEQELKELDIKGYLRQRGYINRVEYVLRFLKLN